MEHLRGARIHPLLRKRLAGTPSNAPIVRVGPRAMDTLCEVYDPLVQWPILKCFVVSRAFGSKGRKVEFFLVLHALPTDPCLIPANLCRGKDGRRRFSAGSSLAPFQLRCPRHPSPNYLIRPVGERPIVRNGTLRPILVIWKIRKTFASQSTIGFQLSGFEGIWRGE